MKHIISVRPIYLITLVLLLGVHQVSGQLSLPELRQLYLEAVESEQKSKEFMEYMASIDHGEPLMYAYFASAQALVAKHISGPSNKLKYLRLGDRSFEEAILKSELDAEIRFLRFSVQHNLPRFLGFSDDMEEDIDVMLQNISKTKSLKDYPDWLKMVVDFVIASGGCSETEKDQFKAMLN